MKLTTTLKNTACMALLAVAAAGANATTTNLGSIANGTTQIYFGLKTPPGSFNDVFTFNLSLNGGSGYSVVDLPILGVAHTSLTSFSLFSNPDGILFNADDSLLAANTSSPTAMTLSWGPSAAGAYYLNVKGLAFGSVGGLYGGAITVTTVPEPETYAMLLAGLGLMGAIARRRNKS